ncbi:MAG TPA: M1 family metallopeptidase [Terriglobales bacterium]|nr:M1 family metallopeptidase [Terriglobales bacterium]
MGKKLFCFLVIVLGTCFVWGQRLPELAVPENYKLSFTPNLDKDNFAGEETIQIRLLQPTSEIVLNAANINFQEVSISAGGITQKARVSLDSKKEMATLAVERRLTAGPATIQIRYSGILNNDLRGFYLGKFGDGKKYAATQFEATDARRAFPCFDEPAYKATFDVTITADRGLTAISNGKIVSDSPGPGDDKHTVRFATTAKMSSYLVAMAVGDFEYVEGSAEGVPIRVYGPPGSKPYSSYALEIGEQCIKYFDEYFGIKYPFEKLDMIGLPDFAAGAMENTALITYRQAMLQIDDKRASVGKHKDVAIYIAHEIAHQWFGDLVTPKWWDDIWLNEGFATWMEKKSVAALRPEWEMDLDGVRDSIGVLNLDSLENTRPVHQNAVTTAQIEELFDGIAYDKAGAVLRMLESYLGPEVFRAGVSAYLKKYAYGNATAEDFWNTLTAVSKKPVDRILPTFVTQPGAPLVDLKLQCAGGSATATLSQERYSYDRAQFNSKNDEIWQVPVCMKEAGHGGGETPNSCVVLSKKEENFSLPSCAPWVLSNAGASGYYRSGYDAEMLRAMSRDLEHDLTPAERIMLLGNVWASVRVGRLQIGDYLAFAEGLQTDRNRGVMGQLTDQLDYIGEYLVTEDDRESYEEWVRRLLTPAAKDLETQAKRGENDEQKSLRARIMQTLGGTGRDSEVLERARQITEQALAHPEVLDRTLARTAFALTAAHGDAALYDKFFDRLQKAKTPEEYYLYLQPLTSFTDPKLLERTLEYALTPAVRLQDTLGLIAGVMSNPAGQRLAWDFVRAHWKEIEKMESGFISAEIVDATSSFCDAGLQEEAKYFFSKHPVPSAERALKQSLERMKYCVDLRSEQGSKLASWLQQRGAATGQ